MRFAAEVVSGVNNETLKATDAFEVSWFVCWLIRFRIILPIFLSSMELSNCWPATISRTARLMPEYRVGCSSNPFLYLQVDREHR